MYNLAYDTTAAQCAVILQKGREKISTFQKLMDFGQAETLIPQMKRMLDEAGISFSDLGLLSVCTGPGSFTGVRSGIAAARAFSIAAPQVKVCGISAFEAYALTFAPEELTEVNAVVIETKRDDFYFQLFDAALDKISAPQAGEYDDLKALLRHKKVSLAGDGVERFLNRPSGLSLHCIKMLEALPVECVAEAGMRRFENKRIDFPKPLYLRAPDVSLPKAKQP